MNDCKTDWLKLIQHWVSRGGNGYTLPFLVGARARLNDSSHATQHDASVMLHEMFDNPVEGYTVLIAFCSQLKTLVYGLYRKTDEGHISGQEYKSKELNHPSVFIRQDVLERYGLMDKDIEEICEIILRDIKAPLEAGKFSSRNGTWQPFNQGEIERIDNVLR